MPDFDAKMHQNRFRLGLRPRARWGSLQRSPRPPSWFRGCLLLREGRGKGEGREREGRGRAPPPFVIPGYVPVQTTSFSVTHRETNWDKRKINSVVDIITKHSLPSLLALRHCVEAEFVQELVCRYTTRRTRLGVWVSASFQKLPCLVGQLGSQPHLMGSLG